MKKNRAETYRREDARQTKETKKTKTKKQTTTKTRNQRIGRKRKNGRGKITRMKTKRRIKKAKDETTRVGEINERATRTPPGFFSRGALGVGHPPVRGLQRQGVLRRFE